MQPTGDTLIDLACRSALYRIEKRFFHRAGVCFDDAIGAIGADMRALGKAARECGVDIRHSPYWPLLEFKDCYEEVFDYNRPVHVQHLTPMAIYESLCRGTRLCYKEWTIKVGGHREATDAYGQPSWEARIWLKVPGAHTFKLYSGISKATARELYREIASKDFEGVDTLGLDEPHAAEGYSMELIQTQLEDAGRLPLITSHRSGPLWEQFYRLSVEHPEDCLAVFDVHGRYRDPVTGFWASIRCERFDAQKRTWFRWRDD